MSSDVWRRISINSFHSLKFNIFLERLDDIKCMEQKATEQYMYTRNSSMDIMRLMTAQRATNRLMHSLKYITAQLGRDLVDLMGANDRLPEVRYRASASEFKDDLDRTTARISRLGEKLARQDTQILRLLEYSLVTRSSSSTGSAEEFLRQHISDPIICSFIIRRDNGLDDSDIDVPALIGDIVSYYSGWLDEARQSDPVHSSDTPLLRSTSLACINEDKTMPIAIPASSDRYSISSSAPVQMGAPKQMIRITSKSMPNYPSPSPPSPLSHLSLSAHTSTSGLGGIASSAST